MQKPLSQKEFTLKYKRIIRKHLTQEQDQDLQYWKVLWATNKNKKIDQLSQKDSNDFIEFYDKLKKENPVAVFGTPQYKKSVKITKTKKPKTKSNEVNMTLTQLKELIDKNIRYHGGEKLISQDDLRPETMYFSKEYSFSAAYSINRANQRPGEAKVISGLINIENPASWSVIQKVCQELGIDTSSYSQAEVLEKPKLKEKLVEMGYDGAKGLMDFGFESDFDEEPVDIVFNAKEQVIIGNPTTLATQYMKDKKSNKQTKLVKIVDGLPSKKMAKGGNVDQDAEIKAKRPGYRIPGTNKVPSKAEIRAGKAYYENRFNRSDDNRRTYPYLAKGGMINIIDTKVLNDGDFQWLEISFEDAKKIFQSDFSVYEIFQTQDDDGNDDWGGALVEDFDDFNEDKMYALEYVPGSKQNGFKVKEGKIKFNSGGVVDSDYEEDEDMLDDYDALPDVLKDIFSQSKYDDIFRTGSGNSSLLPQLLDETEEVGYTFEFDLEGMPVLLREMTKEEKRAYDKKPMPSFEPKEPKTGTPRQTLNIPIIKIEDNIGEFFGDAIYISKTDALRLFKDEHVGPIEIFGKYSDGSAAEIDYEQDIAETDEIFIFKDDLPEGYQLSEDETVLIATPIMAKGGNVDQDAEIKAKRPGYRIPGTNKVPSKAEIRAGKAYYENRFNRSDDNRRTYPYLKKGGIIQYIIDGEAYTSIDYNMAVKLFEETDVAVYVIDPDYKVQNVELREDLDADGVIVIKTSDEKFSKGGQIVNYTIDGVDYTSIEFDKALELFEDMEINVFMIDSDENVLPVEYREDFNADGDIVIRTSDVPKMAKGGNVEQDAEIKAKRPGYRIPGTNKVPSKAEIRAGKAYYENRFNRSDDNRRTYPYLKKGGNLMAKESMRYFVLNEMSSGFVVNFANDADTYKEADAIKARMIQMLDESGDRQYSLEAAIRLIRNAEKSLNYYAKGGKLDSNDISDINFSKVRFPKDRSVVKVYHHSSDPNLKELNSSRYTGYTVNSHTYGPMGRLKESSFMRFIDTSDLVLATEKQIWALKSGGNWNENLKLADKKGFDGVVYKVYGDTAYILFDNSKAIKPEQYTLQLYNELKAQDPKNWFVKQIDSLVDSKYAFGGTTSTRSIPVEEIAYYTGMNTKAIENFASKHSISEQGLENIATALRKKQILSMDVVTAVVGKPGNKYEKHIVTIANGSYPKFAQGGGISGSLIKSTQHKND